MQRLLMLILFRCLPHVINIAVKTGLKYMTRVSTKDLEKAEDIDDDTYEDLMHVDEDYRDALAADLVAVARKLVADSRSSGTRRERLAEIIKKGREEGSWELDSLELLRDVDTRWSSIYYMLDRFIYLYPVCCLAFLLFRFSDTLQGYRDTRPRV